MTVKWSDLIGRQHPGIRNSERSACYTQLLSGRYGCNWDLLGYHHMSHHHLHCIAVRCVVVWGICDRLHNRQGFPDHRHPKQSLRCRIEVSIYENNKKIIIPKRCHTHSHLRYIFTMHLVKFSRCWIKCLWPSPTLHLTNSTSPAQMPSIPSSEIFKRENIMYINHSSGRTDHLLLIHVQEQRPPSLLFLI